jgi:hypothetical protein
MAIGIIPPQSKLIINALVFMAMSFIRTFWLQGFSDYYEGPARFVSDISDYREDHQGDYDADRDQSPRIERSQRAQVFHGRVLLPSGSLVSMLTTRSHGRLFHRMTVPAKN